MQENLIILEKNTRNSFALAKRDIYDLNNRLNQHVNYIKKLNDNQKSLLLRIRELENQLIVKEKKIVLKSNKTVSRKEFVGAKTSKKLHEQVCPYGKNIKPKNKIVFKTKAKAYNHGFKPCECLKKF